MTLNSGVLTAPSGTFNITGDWTKSSGTFTPGSNTVTFSGSGSQSISSGGTSFNNLTITNTGGACTALSNITATTLDNGGGGSVAAILDMAGNTLTATTIDNTGATIRFSGASNGLAIGTGTVEYSNTSGGQTVATGTYTNLTLSNTSGTQTAGGDLTVNAALTTATGGTLDLGTNQILGTLSTINHNGTIQTQNTSLTPIPSGKIWNGSGTVVYNGSTYQTAVAGTFYNMTIDNPISVTLSGDATLNGTLLINSGKTLEINTGAQMNAHAITNNAGVYGLIIDSSSSAPNGTLIFSGTAPNATVQMYSPAAATNFDSGTGKYSNYKWQFFGIPIQSVQASPTFDGSYVRKYNELGTVAANNYWVNQSSSAYLAPLYGYEITQAVATTIEFQGQLVNSDQTTPQLTYTLGAANPGMHILSNPFTAAIDNTKISYGSDMQQSIWLYTTGSLADWTAAGGGTGNNPGQYNVYNSLVTTMIPSMQGILVQFLGTVTSSSSNSYVTFPYSAVTKNVDKQRVTGIKSSNADKVGLQIDVRGLHSSDRMWLFSLSECTRNFDNGFDGYKILGSVYSPQLYAIETDGKYQIDAVDDMNNTQLGFRAGQDVDYTMTFTPQNIKSKYDGLYLMDLQENKTVEVTDSGSNYSFTASSASPFEKRFIIITSPQTTQNKLDFNSKIKIFSTNGSIFVKNYSYSSGNILIYDIAGHFLKKEPLTSNGIVNIPGNLSGTYIVKVITENENINQTLLVKNSSTTVSKL